MRKKNGILLSLSLSSLFSLSLALNKPIPKANWGTSPNSPKFPLPPISSKLSKLLKLSPMLPRGSFWEPESGPLNGTHEKEDRRKGESESESEEEEEEGYPNELWVASSFAVRYGEDYEPPLEPLNPYSYLYSYLYSYSCLRQ